VSPSRKYTSPIREADAAQTRARIVDAAALLFARDGYAATPLRAIAVEAGVSVQSVHLAGPKSSLLLAAFERTFAGDEGDHSLNERPALIDIMSQPNVVDALEGYVAFITDANRRAAGIWRALHAAADADERVREAAADLDKRRRADVRAGAGWMVARNLIAPESEARTADLLGFLTVPDTYWYFVEDSGWTVEEYRAWLRTALEKLILAP
jgi:AcrR family transcriptional regulator